MSVSLKKGNIYIAILSRVKFRNIILTIILILALAFIIYPFIPKPANKPKATKIDEFTYNFQDGSTNSCMYLLLGEDRALLIDTGFGMSKLDEALKEITDLPITVVNTHGHYDHVGTAVISAICWTKPQLPNIWI